MISWIQIGPADHPLTFSSSDYSSSNACPQGCGEKIIRFSSLEQLRRLEQEAVEKVKQANAELVDARNSVKRWISNIDAEQNDEVSNHTSEAKKDDGLRVMSIEEGKSQESQALPHSLRQRRLKSSKNQWEQAQCLAASISGYPNGNTSFRCCGTSGSCTKGDGVILTSATNVKRSFLGSDEAKFTLKQVVSILEHPTYAVVTFTSRQAAVAARQCLVDGSGLDRWIEIEEVRLPGALEYRVSVALQTLKSLSFSVSLGWNLSSQWHL